MLTIHEVSIQHINSSHSDELQTLKAFFAVDNQTDFDDFIQKYGNTPYGRLLLDAYNDATRNSTLLDNLSEEEKYMIRLTDEERFADLTLHAYCNIAEISFTVAVLQGQGGARKMGKV